MSQFYILEGKTPKPITIEEYVELGLEKTNRVVERTELPNGILVSTIFLMFDHQLYPGDGPPILFETMIFGLNNEEYQERYCTYDEAVAGHQKAIEYVFEVK